MEVVETFEKKRGGKFELMPIFKKIVTFLLKIAIIYHPCGICAIILVWWNNDDKPLRWNRICIAFAYTYYYYKRLASCVCQSSQIDHSFTQISLGIAPCHNDKTKTKYFLYFQFAS